VTQLPGSIVTTSGTCINVNGSDFSCNLLTLNPGSTVEVRVKYTVPADANTCSVTNVATVSSLTFDPELCDNDAKDVNALVERAAVTLSKTDGVSEISGSDLSAKVYTITVGNAGPSTARDVVITDRWPAGFVQFLQSLKTTAGRCVGTGNDFTCSLGDVAVGETVSVTVSYNLMQPPMCGEVVNHVTAFSPTDEECREAFDTTVVVCEAKREARALPTVTKVEAPKRIEPIVTQGKKAKNTVHVEKHGRVLKPRLVELKVESQGQGAFEIKVKNTLKSEFVLESMTLKSGKRILDATRVSDMVKETTCGVAHGAALREGWSATCRVVLKEQVSDLRVSVRGVQQVQAGFHPIMASALASPKK